MRNEKNMQKKVGLVLFLAVLLAVGLFVPRLLHAGRGAAADCPMMGSGSAAQACEAMAKEGCPMMGGSGPERALEHRAELGLTADQVEALEALASDVRERRARTAERMQALLTAEQADQIAERAGRSGMAMCMQMMHGQGAMGDCPMMGQEPDGEPAKSTGDRSR